MEIIILRMVTNVVGAIRGVIITLLIARGFHPIAKIQRQNIMAVLIPMA